MIATPASAPPPPPPRKRIRRGIWVGLALLVLAALAWGGYTRIYPDWRAERALKSAQKASADSDYDAARAHLEEFLRIRPKSAQGHFLMARASWQTDDLTAARKHLREAKAAGWPRDELELEEHLIEAQDDGPRGENEKALQALVLARHPAERAILEALAKGYLNVHVQVAAVKWLGIWIERYPDDWLPLRWRGEILATYNFPDDARIDLLRVLQLKPRQSATLRRLGQLELSARRDAVSAAGHFAVLLEVIPDDPDGLLGAAECRRMQGDAAGAREYLARLLAREPNNARGCLEYAVLEAEANRSAEALAWAKRAEATLPDEPDLHFQIGSLYNRLALPESAAPHLARYEVLNGVYRTTLEWLTQLLQDPSNADLRCRIGEEFFRIGRDATAVAWVSSALLEKPDHKPSHRALAAYYRRIGDAPRAAEHLRLGGAEK